LETQRKKVYLIDMKYSLNDAQRHQITWNNMEYNCGSLDNFSFCHALVT
jgi:hypothetical protein